MMRNKRMRPGIPALAALVLGILCLMTVRPAYAVDTKTAPKLTKLEAVSYTSQKLTWQARSGAKGYQVYRKKTGASSWTSLGKVTSTSYVSKSLSCGTSYTYTVRAYFTVKGSTVYSSYDKTGLTKVCCPATPALVSVTNTSPGAQKITCKAVDGATAYRFYIKGGKYGTKWTCIGNPTGTSFEMKGLTTGETYTYTVRARRVVNGKDVWSDYVTAGLKKLCAPADPVLKKVAAVDTTTQDVSWNKVTGAEGYRIYRKASGAKSWTELGDTAGTTWRSTGLSCGTTYYYTVRAFVDIGETEVLGGYDAAGISGLCRPAAPVLSKAVSTGSRQCQVTWKSVSGAGKYYVYRKTGSGSWKKIGSVTGTTWNDTGLTVGTTYYYTVRAVKVVSSKDVLSDYDNTGLLFKAK